MIAHIHSFKLMWIHLKPDCKITQEHNHTCPFAYTYEKLYVRIGSGRIIYSRPVAFSHGHLVLHSSENQHKWSAQKIPTLGAQHTCVFTVQGNLYTYVTVPCRNRRFIPSHTYFDCIAVFEALYR